MTEDAKVHGYSMVFIHLVFIFIYITFGKNPTNVSILSTFVIKIGMTVVVYNMLFCFHITDLFAVQVFLT